MFVASTGVIGEVLPHERLIAALPALHEGLRADGWEEAARGIMTTDTFPKAATRTARIGDATVRITGIAKGSGMIAPDMATMLCFVFTDAKIPAEALQPAAAAERGCAASTARRSIRDTSTSDTVLLFATGQAKHPRVPAEGGKLLRDFARALDEVLLDLALMVVRDGEGAQKLVRIDVTGAVTSPVRQAGRAGGRQLAAGEDGDRRRGRQLGPHRHGGGQSGRARRPRPPVDRRGRGVDGARRRRGAGLRRGAGGGAHERAARSTSPSISGWARGAPRFGPAI